jgi:hypothetical protein
MAGWLAAVYSSVCANFKMLHAFTKKLMQKVELQNNALYELSLQDTFSLPNICHGTVGNVYFFS